MRSLMRTQVSLLAIIAGACGPGYYRYQHVQIAPQKLPSDAYEIWSGGKIVKWTHVVITRDSVRGRLATNLQQSLPRGAVDSIRLAQYVPGGGETAVIIVGTLAFSYLFYLATIACEEPGPSCPLDHGK
jgi:hypothetical protein